MSVLKIRCFPDPILKQPTPLVKAVDAKIDGLIRSMVKTMYHYPHCVGLAAVQVGLSLRLAVMDASVHPKGKKKSHGLLVMVNPKLEPLGATKVSREGCLSVPDFTGNVYRSKEVRLNALDHCGEPYSLELKGFEAIVAQHEVDHLDGKLFLDRVSNRKTDIFERKKYL